MRRREGGDRAEEGNTVDFHEEGRCNRIVDDQRGIGVNVGVRWVILRVKSAERRHQQGGEHGMDDVLPLLKLGAAVLNELELLLRRKVLLLQTQIRHLNSVELQVVPRPSRYVTISNRQKGDCSCIGL